MSDKKYPYPFLQGIFNEYRQGLLKIPFESTCYDELNPLIGSPYLPKELYDLIDRIIDCEFKYFIHWIVTRFQKKLGDYKIQIIPKANAFESAIDLLTAQVASLELFTEPNILDKFLDQCLGCGKILSSVNEKGKIKRGKSYKFCHSNKCPGLNPDTYSYNSHTASDCCYGTWNKEALNLKNRLKAANGRIDSKTSKTYQIEEFTKFCDLQFMKNLRLAENTLNTSYKKAEPIIREGIFSEEGEMADIDFLVERERDIITCGYPTQYPYL